MIGKIARGEGIGILMGEGSAKMAAALGKNAVEFAVHVKGLEPSAHDPRRFFSQALSYGTAARGACHNASWSHPYEMGLSMPEIGLGEPQDPYLIEGKADDLTNQLPPMGRLLADYYEHRGWTEEGLPSAEKLAELGIPEG